MIHTTFNKCYIIKFYLTTTMEINKLTPAICKHACSAQNTSACYHGKALLETLQNRIKDMYVASHGKKPSMPDNKLGKILDEYHLRHPKDSCKTLLAKMMEVLENYDKYNVIIEGIKSDERCAQSFFFNNPSVIRIFTLLNISYNNDFRIDSPVSDISTFVYEAMWENNWRRLNSYRYESSLYTWLKKVASDILLSTYIDQGRISPRIFTSPGCYRLALRSQDSDTRKYAVNLVEEGPMHDILDAVYLKKWDEQTIISSLGIKHELFKQTLKAAETCLIKELIELNNIYTLKILRHKKEKPSTWQAVAVDNIDIADNLEPSKSDILMTYLVGCTWQFGNLDDFLYYASERMGWDDTDKWIWQSRYFKGTTSKEMSVKIGREPAWIDVRYCRLCKALAKAIKKRFADS